MTRQETNMFIELHKLPECTPILINTSNILSVAASAKDGALALIHLSDPKMQSVTVRESYRDVKNKLPRV
jgi:hypothetical protein